MDYQYYAVFARDTKIGDIGGIKKSEYLEIWGGNLKGDNLIKLRKVQKKRERESQAGNLNLDGGGGEKKDLGMIFCVWWENGKSGIFRRF